MIRTWGVSRNTTSVKPQCEVCPGDRESAKKAEDSVKCCNILISNKKQFASSY